MPAYEFECNKCKNKFEISISMKDRENAKIVCPKCKSENVNQLFYGVNINTNSTSKRKSNGCCGGSGCC